MPEVSNELTTNEGFAANILRAPGDEHIVSIMQAFCKLPLKDLASNDDLLCRERERERFAGIDDKQIIVHFHGLGKRRGHLPESPCIMT